jgi:hypothetical protein
MPVVGSPAFRLCTYQLDEQAQPYNGNDVRFGTHQLREVVDRDCMLFVTGSRQAFG